MARGGRFREQMEYGRAITIVIPGETHGINQEGCLQKEKHGKSGRPVGVKE